MIYTDIISTPLGKMRAAAQNGAIIGLWFEGQKHYPIDSDKWQQKNSELFEALRVWLKSYFAGENPPNSLLLAPNGTPFQKKVWEILLSIPFGQTTTYGEIAKAIAKDLGISKMSAQAVGGAVGHNRISLIIPCHRVVGADGNLTGYAGGIEKKRFLLQLEKVKI